MNNIIRPGGKQTLNHWVLVIRSLSAEGIVVGLDCSFILSMCACVCAFERSLTAATSGELRRTSAWTVLYSTGRRGATFRKVKRIPQALQQPSRIKSSSDAQCHTSPKILYMYPIGRLLHVSGTYTTSVLGVERINENWIFCLRWRCYVKGANVKCFESKCEF